MLRNSYEGVTSISSMCVSSMNSIKGNSSLSMVSDMLSFDQSIRIRFLAGPNPLSTAWLLWSAVVAVVHVCLFINRFLIMETLARKDVLRFFRFRGVDAVMDGSVPGATRAFCACASSTEGNEPFGRRFPENERLNSVIFLFSQMI